LGEGKGRGLFIEKVPSPILPPKKKNLSKQVNLCKRTGTEQKKKNLSKQVNFCKRNAT
jgi:hypothetical protein